MPVERTTAQPSPVWSETPPALSTNFRHSGWTTARRATHDAFTRLGLPYHRRLAFANCGTGLWILRHKSDPERYRAVSDHCHDRFCVPCSAQRQALIRSNLNHYLHDRPHRFLTLTIRNTDQDLAPLITRLYKSFRRLRSRQFWKDRVRGGVAFLELTYNPDRRSWNPHLHCMLDGKYLDLQALSRTWLDVTGDSMSVKIKLIRQRSHVVNYITKYATKPLPSSILQHPDALDETIQALRRRRTVLAFGTWRRWKLLEDPTEWDWTLVDHLGALEFRAANEDPLALNILAMLETRDPYSGEFYVHVESPEPES